MKDGGAESNVTGYWLFEIKSLLSVGILKFEDGSREAFHSHAFNCLTWILSGKLREEMRDGRVYIFRTSAKPYLTTRKDYHKVTSLGRTWALTIRGPWLPKWLEYLPNERRERTLTHGRIEVI